MSETPNDNLGHLDDDQEAAETSSTTEGAAAQGDYDPAQGSPHGTPHPVGDGYPDETEGADPISEE